MKTLVKFCGAVIFSCLMFYNMGTMGKTSTSVTLDVLELQAFASTETLCWNFVEPCWLWGCVWVTPCGDCDSKKSDDWWDMSECTD